MRLSLWYPAAGGLAVALLVSVVAAPASRADHTPVPTLVALVGSLQSELGCPGDWAPECPATRLQPVDGSPGVFRGTFDVPPGSYESYRLHPVQAAGADPVVKQSTYAAGTFTVPARTVAVFLAR